MSLRQRPEMIPVYRGRFNLRANRTDRWFLVASENSWTLPFLDQPNMKWELTPQWDQVKALLVQGAPGDAYALVLNCQLPQDIPFEVMKKYPGSNFHRSLFSDNSRETVKASSGAKLTYRAPKRVLFDGSKFSHPPLRRPTPWTWRAKNSEEAFMLLRAQEENSKIIEKVVAHLRSAEAARSPGRDVHSPVLQTGRSQDLAERKISDLCGAAPRHLEFMREFKSGAPKLRVYNPQIQKDGWESTHTVIEIVNDDMPFLVDSVTMEVNRQGLTLHLIIQPVMNTQTGREGWLD